MAQSSNSARDRVFDRADLDTTCSPCRSFYQFANGGWLASHPLPPSHSIWGDLEGMTARADSVLGDVLQAAARDTNAAPGTELRKLGDYYGSCMDTVRIDAVGARPLRGELARIEEINGPGKLAGSLARLHLQGVDALFRIEAAPDFKQSTRVIATLSQAGLGLPDRDQYLERNPGADSLRTAYLAYIARVFELVGLPGEVAQYRARRVLTLETALAQASMGAVEARDPNAVYHLIPVSDLQYLAPAFPWREYFAQLDLNRLRQLNVAQPEFVRGMNRLVQSVPLVTWRWYFRWRLLHRFAPALGTPFAAEDFRFRRLLTGTSAPIPRSLRCLRITEAALGQALGRAYVERSFDPASRAAADDLVVDLQAVLRDRLAALAWMSDATRRQALAKLDALGRKIGYPDSWRDYSGLRVIRGSYLENLQRAREFAIRLELAKIGLPLDRRDWWTVTPQTVDAFYSQFTNEIILPAGELQPPAFDPGADLATTYGGMGATIGHELTHAFDDGGRQFDAQGNLRDWWAPGDAKRFAARARLLVEQFNSYPAVAGIHVNGQLTLGENIADLGGIRIAYEALQRSLVGKSREPIDGFTAEQRFFLAYARGWRAHTRPEVARVQALVDRHAPRRWRVDGPLSNMPEFARAFGCRTGDPMVRPDSLRVEVW